MHRTIGPGVFEKSYAECLTHELKGKGCPSRRESHVPLIYRGVSPQGEVLRRLVVENQVIIELKAVAEVAKFHECQVLTQLKLTGLPVGLLINFNVPWLVDGVTRLVNPTLKSRETQDI